MDTAIIRELERAKNGFLYPTADQLVRDHDAQTLARMVVYYQEQSRTHSAASAMYSASDLRKSKELHNLHKKLHRMRKHMSMLDAVKIAAKKHLETIGCGAETGEGACEVGDECTICALRKAVYGGGKVSCPTPS